MAWSEKRLRAYQKRVPQAPGGAERRESGSGYQNSVGAAFRAQNGGIDFNHAEEAFVTAWKEHTKIPFPFERCAAVRTNRRMTFDFADRSVMLAVEIDGGIHGTYIYEGQTLLNRQQMEADREKWNLANIDGWTLLNYTDRQVIDEPTKVIAQVLAVWQKRKETKAAGK